MIATRDEAIALLLARQGLTPPGYTRTATNTLEDVVSCVQRIGILQIDTIHVVARSPYIVLWSRLGAYEPALLDQALAERHVFEYWSHEASFLPVAHLPYSRVLMHRQTTARPWLPERLEATAPILERVIGQIERAGEARAADFARDIPGSGQGWWDWKPEKIALEDLFRIGRVTVARRERFHRIYRRWEDHFPELDDASLPDGDAVADQHVRVAARALGIATVHWLADYFRRPQAETKGAVQRLVASGELLLAEIEGIGAGYMMTDTPALLDEIRDGQHRPSDTVLLSPFDPVVWHRARARALFDFDYRLESYTPEAKRRYGYFTLPILHEGRLVGRLDPKAHRQQRRLEVRAIHLEPGIEVTADLLDGIARALVAFAAWQELDEVEIVSSTPPGLRRRLTPAIRRQRAGRRRAGATAPAV